MTEKNGFSFLFILAVLSGKSEGMEVRAVAGGHSLRIRSLLASQAIGFLS